MYFPNMIRRTLTTACFFGALSAGPALAQDHSEAVAQGASPTVVELFVSANCLACPTAYKNLREIEAGGADFLQLTWSVDYWDYLGGDDPLAIDASAERQRKYAERMELRGPYTPQAVFNGIVQTSGARKSAVTECLRYVGGQAGDARIRIASEGDTLFLEGGDVPVSDILLLEVQSLESRGEWLNNAVSDVRKIGDWSGGAAEVSFECASRCIVLVQEADLGPIHAAYQVPVETYALPNH